LPDHCDREDSVMFKRVQVNAGLFHSVAWTAVAAAAISTAGGTPIASAQPSWGDWWARASVHVHAMEDAFEDATIAAKTHNIGALHDACQRLQNAVTGLSAFMPAPDPALTAPLQAAIEDYNASKQYCDASVHDMSPSDLQQAETHLSEGDDRMDQAITVLENEPI
jgi:hypothetical protein